MPRTLILMRHAKSDWSTALPDHDRPLNDRGRRSARALGDWLRSRGLDHPDLVLCSSARRTAETLAGLALEADTRFLRPLYHAEAEAMLEQLCQADGALVLMIGHNPGIADFAQRLVADPPDHPRFDDYPTGATLVAEFPGEDWRATGFGQATARAFVTPRDLI